MGRLDDLVEGRSFPFTLELRDPLGNSFISFQGDRYGGREGGREGRRVGYSKARSKKCCLWLTRCRVGGRRRDAEGKEEVGFVLPNA